MSRIPVYISPERIAKILDDPPDDPWTSRRARDWLIDNNAAIKVAGKWRTTRALLLRAFPDVWDEICEDAARAADDAA